jgi:hypothetical protein
MLPRMQQKRHELAFTPLHRFHNGRDLHKVGPRAHDIENFQHVISNQFSVFSFLL